MINIYKFIDKFVGIPLCILTGMLAKIFPKNTSADFKKILIIKVWALGDSVVSLPLVANLRKNYPYAQIDVLARKRNVDVFKNLPIINNIHLLELGNLKIIIRLVRKYDLVIDTEPYLRLSAILSVMLGKRRIGFAGRARSLVYTDSTHFKQNQHMVENYLDMARILGIDTKTDSLVKLETTAEEKMQVAKFLSAKKIKKSDFLIGICAGVAESARSRMWAEEKYAQVADELIKKYNAKIIFTGGVNEKEQIEKITSRMRYKKLAVNSAGELQLRSVFHLIELCRLFISNDTGPMHIASAQGVATIGLFGPNTPVLWAPFGRKNKSVYHKLECSPCIKNDEGFTPDCLRETDRYLCMRLITPEDVLKTIREVLA